MTDEHFAAAFHGLPRPTDAPDEPYRIMCITYAAYRAALLEASTGTIIRSFAARWDALSESEKHSLAVFADAFIQEYAPIILPFCANNTAISANSQIIHEQPLTSGPGDGKLSLALR